MSSESNDENTWTFSQNFTAQFQASTLDLETRIAAFTVPPSGPELEGLSSEIAKLSKSLSDAMTSLPAYDQRLHSGQIKGIEEKIEAFRIAGKPKSRFAFKRKVPVATVSSVESTSTPQEERVSSPKDLSGTSKTKGTIQPSGDPTSLSKGLEISNQSERYLTWADLPSPAASDSVPDLAISNLSRCVVDLLPSNVYQSKFSALHIRDLSDCILLLPLNEGSALIHDVKNCVLVLGCHQFRMHTSIYVDVYLRIKSNPIIETCSNIRFAAYPTQLVPQLLQEPPQPQLTVQDFSHIRASPSPNFSLVGEEAETGIKTWPIGGLSNREKEIASTLAALLPGSNAGL